MKSNYGRKGDYELFEIELIKTFLRHQNEIFKYTVGMF